MDFRLGSLPTCFGLQMPITSTASHLPSFLTTGFLSCGVPTSWDTQFPRLQWLKATFSLPMPKTGMWFFNNETILGNQTYKLNAEYILLAQTNRAMYDCGSLLHKHRPLCFVLGAMWLAASVSQIHPSYLWQISKVIVRLFKSVTKNKLGYL